MTQTGMLFLLSPKSKDSIVDLPSSIAPRARLPCLEFWPPRGGSFSGPAEARLCLQLRPRVIPLFHLLELLVQLHFQPPPVLLSCLPPPFPFLQPSGHLESAPHRGPELNGQKPTGMGHLRAQLGALIRLRDKLPLRDEVE